MTSFRTVPSFRVLLTVSVLAMPAAAQDPPLRLAARGADGRLLTAAAPGAWSASAALLAGSPDAAAGFVGLRGTDDALWIVPPDAAASERVESVVRSGPALARDASGNLAAVVIGADQAAWAVERRGGAWGAWQSLGGVFPTGAAPDAAWTASGRLVVVARGTDDAAWTNSRTAGAWSGWSPLGVRTAGDPSVTAEGHVFVVGTDRQVHRVAAGGASAQPLGGEFPAGAGVDACADGAGAVAVTARGLDGAAWVNRFQGGKWSGWESWGGTLTEDPTCSFAENGSAGAVVEAKSPWLDPGAMQAALARWSEPVGAVSPKALELLQERVQGLDLDPGALAAHVVRPKDAGLEVFAPPDDPAPPSPPASLGPDVDYLTFRSGAMTALESSAGYYLELRKNGHPVVTLVKHWARMPAGGRPGLEWTSGRRMHVASVSKLVTAMAMTKLLGERGISLDAPFAPYLPASWELGAGVSSLTFRQLLTHQSGLMTRQPFPPGDSSYPAMRSAIAAGASTSRTGYQNLNYGLCRVLLPIVAGNVDRGAVFAPLTLTTGADDGLWDFVTIQAYVAYVERNVLAPSGVRGPTIAPLSDDALAYTLPPGAGWESDSPRTLWYMTATSGWHFSADELLQIMATFRRGGTIVDPDAARRMLEAGVGIDASWSTAAGRMHAKNGYWEEPASGCEQALAMFLPGDMELVVLVNSRLAAGSSPSLQGAMAAVLQRSLRP